MEFDDPPQTIKELMEKLHQQEQQWQRLDEIDAPQIGIFYEIVILGTFDYRFCWYASPIQTHTANFFFLNYRGFQSDLSGTNCSNITCRS